MMLNYFSFISILFFLGCGKGFSPHLAPVMNGPSADFHAFLRPVQNLNKDPMGWSRLTYHHRQFWVRVAIMSVGQHREFLHVLLPGKKCEKQRLDFNSPESAFLQRHLWSSVRDTPLSGRTNRLGRHFFSKAYDQRFIPASYLNQDLAASLMLMTYVFKPENKTYEPVACGLFSPGLGNVAPNLAYPIDQP